MFKLLIINVISLVMAWGYYFDRNAELVRNMRNKGVIKSDVVESVMLQVDHDHYAPLDPYMKTPRIIGYESTTSAPRIHALALEVLKGHLTPGKRGLNVGSGSGYMTVCMALMLGKSGIAASIDHIPETVETTEYNIRQRHPELLSSKRIQLFVGDGRVGIPQLGPYAAIYVGGASPILPQALIKQLRLGGRLVVPIGPPDGTQTLVQVDKVEDGTVEIKSLAEVMFSPLTSKFNQCNYPIKTVIATTLVMLFVIK